MQRNYAAERREAGDYADSIMNGKDLPTPQWTATWDLIYQAYLAGLRSALRRISE
jgi:hypothetical protein